MWCHLVFLTPLFGLILFWVFPWPIAVGLYLVLLVVSSAVYVVTYRAMRLPVTTGATGMIGLRGQVVRAIESRGTVRIYNELWTAIADQPLPVGTSVRVIAVQGLVLHVAPEPNSELRA